MNTHSIAFGRHHAKAHRPALHVGNQFVITHPKSSGDPEHDKLVKETQKWVSQTFYGEMLKQMRNSPFKDKLMSGGHGGEAFTEMFDQRMADKMASGTGQKLVNAIVNKIEANKAYHKTNTPMHNHLRGSRLDKLSAAIGGGA